MLGKNKLRERKITLCESPDEWYLEQPHPQRQKGQGLLRARGEGNGSDCFGCSFIWGHR